MKCIKCQTNIIECINLGFINCKWHYKIKLLNDNNAILKGDNMTIGNKLHILTEQFQDQDFYYINILVNKISRNIIESSESDNLLSVGLVSYRNPSEYIRFKNKIKKQKDSKEIDLNILDKEFSNNIKLELQTNSKCSLCLENKESSKNCIIF